MRLNFKEIKKETPEAVLCGFLSPKTYNTHLARVRLRLECVLLNSLLKVTE